MMPRVVVYGTLMSRGRANWMLQRSTFLRQVDLPGFVMYDLGAFPAVVPGYGAVRGELWHVPEDVLERLDRYEGVPTLYRRERIRVGQSDAWMWVWAGDVPAKARMVPDGTWRK